MPKNGPIRLLTLWGAQDTEFLRDAFFERDQYEVTLVTSDRSKQRSDNAMTRGRFAELRDQLMFGDFDLVISNNVFHCTWPLQKSLATRLAVWFRFATYKRRMLDSYWAPKLVRAARYAAPHMVVDLRDPCFVLPNDLEALEHCTLYFKRELFFNPARSLLTLSHYYGAKRVEPLVEKIRSLSYGATSHMLGKPLPDFAARDIDLFISGVGNVLRDDIRQRVQKLADTYNVKVVTKPLPKAEYADCLSRTKLVVCVESFGCETWRQYDAAAHGAVALLNWPFTQNRYAMVPDEHAIYFSMIGDDFEKTVHAALADSARLKRISAAGHTFVNQYKDRKLLADEMVEATLALAPKHEEGEHDDHH